MQISAVNCEQFINRPLLVIVIPTLTETEDQGGPGEASQDPVVSN